MNSKLKKVSFLTGQPNNPAQMSAVTFKDNLISGAQTFIQSRYPWLQDQIDLVVAESDAENATALLVGNVVFENTNYKLEFPIVYSDGEFLDVPGFYIPESNTWTTFDEKFYNQIKESLSDNITMGDMMEMSVVPAHENYEFTKDLGSDLLVDTSNARYASITSILSNVPASTLKSFIKTAVNRHPSALNILYPAYKISDIKTKQYIKPLTKKASKDINWKPNIAFTSIKQVINAPESLFKSFGITKSAAVKNIDTQGYAALSNKYVDIEMINGKSLLTFDDSAELVSSNRMYDKIEKTLEGKALGFIDAMTGDTSLYIKTTSGVCGGLHHNECCSKSYYDGHSSNSYKNTTGNAQPSYNVLFEKVHNAEDIIHDDSPNYLIKFMSPKLRDKLVNEVFSAKLTFNYIADIIKECYGDFTTGKRYEGYMVKVPCILPDGKIASSCLPNDYPNRYMFTIVDLKNGYKKLIIDELNRVDTGNFENSIEKTVPKKIAEYIYNNDNGVVIKIRTDQGLIKTTEDNPIKVMPIENYGNKTFKSAMSDYSPIVHLVGGKSNYTVFFNTSSDKVCRDLKNYNAIVHAALSDTNTIIIKRNAGSSDQGSDIYDLIYRSRPENGNSVALDKMSRLDLITTLLSTGMDEASVNSVIKTAEVKDNIMFAIKPRPGTEESAPAPEDKRKQDLDTKEYELMDKQLGMMFEFIKNKFDDIESGMADKDELLSKQLELYASKIESVDALAAKLDEMSKSLTDVMAVVSNPPAQTMPAAAPEQQVSADPNAAMAPTQAPTLDPQTAQLIAQSITDPNVAAQNGFDPQTLQLIQSAVGGDQNAVAQLGMTPADVAMLSDAMSAMSAGTPAPGPMPAPAMGSAMPQQAPGMAPEVPGHAPAGQAPQDAVMMAENLVSALFDPNVAQQMGVTDQDKQYVMTIVNDPASAISQGEDPNMVNAVVDAYNRIAGMGNMQNSMNVAAQPGQAALMPMTDAAQPAVAAMQGANMPAEASIMESTSLLLDMLPRIKSSKLFYKYTPDFKKMLSILGELLFSLQYQSAKYKKALGNEAFDNTIGTLRKLYEDFGDFILKMYTIDGN